MAGSTLLVQAMSPPVYMILLYWLHFEFTTPYEIMLLAFYSFVVAWMGESEKLIRDLFAHARSSAGCNVCIDILIQEERFIK